MAKLMIGSAPFALRLPSELHYALEEAAARIRAECPGSSTTKADVVRMALIAFLTPKADAVQPGCKFGDTTSHQNQ